MKSDASKVLGPAPRLVLAMAEFRKGHEEEAQKTLRGAILSFDWSMPRADSRDPCINHALRREAEATLRIEGSGKHDGALLKE